MGEHRDALKELHATGMEIREHIGDVYAAYSALHKAALSDGVLSAKVKELMALAVGMATQCEGCIASHARGAARQGATEAEVAETIGVAIQMMGGPGTVRGPEAWRAYKEFADVQ